MSWGKIYEEILERERERRKTKKKIITTLPQVKYKKKKAS